MVEHHMLILLKLIITIPNVVSGVLESPPKFILPTHLDDPESLTIIGNNSQLTNTLTCAARNADTIEWRYRKNRNSGFETIPKPFVQGESIKNADGILFVSLTDQNQEWNIREKLNGYYQCFARNNRGYAAMTPPIRFILPAIPHDAEDYAPRAETGNIYAPLRLKCIDSRITLNPPDLAQWGVARYIWQIFTPKANIQDSSIIPIQENSRIRIDQRTGDLFFAYLLASDGFGTQDYAPEYQCMITLGVKPGMYTGSRTHLSVTVSEEKTGYVLQAPVHLEEKQVTCIEGNKCLLSCVYGGRENGRDPPAPIWTQPGSTTSVAVNHMSMSVVFTAIAEVQGRWNCSLDENSQKGFVDLKVLSYPRVSAEDMRDQFIEVGSEVTYSCNARHSTMVEFYVNGTKLRAGAAMHIDYTEGAKSFTVTNAQRNHSTSVVCIAYNEAGVLYRAAELNVYDKPIITVNPENGHILSDNHNMTGNELSMDCTAHLDSKVKTVSLHWSSNHSDFKALRIVREHGLGIKDVTTTLYRDGVISSKITFTINTVTQYDILGGHWWCEIEMEIPDLPKPITVKSPAVPLTLAKPIPSVVAAASFDDWWLIGVIVAAFFFILIIILIICCVKHHRGEDYYVDEKERKAGHNPEEELGQYGFSDYKRPATGGYMPIHMSDQDPIKGSRTSMDVSEKPIDSDNGSMDDYGDIDPGRFNEDGSFIGAYGKSSTNLDV